MGQSQIYFSNSILTQGKRLILNPQSDKHSLIKKKLIIVCGMAPFTKDSKLKDLSRWDLRRKN